MSRAFFLLFNVNHIFQLPLPYSQKTKLKILTRILLVLYFLLAPIFSIAQSNPTLLVMGDSLSAEYGLKRGSGWVALLDQQLKKDGSRYFIFNASISGETTVGGVARIAALLEQKKPKIVIIELGANDALRGLPLQSTEMNLLNMIQMSKMAGAKVLLLGIQIPPNYGQEYTQNFKWIYAKLAQKEQIALLPFFLEGVAQKPELFQADQIHPNGEAQPILFRNVWGALAPFQKMLKSQNP